MAFFLSLAAFSQRLVCRKGLRPTVHTVPGLSSRGFGIPAVFLLPSSLPSAMVDIVDTIDLAIRLSRVVSASVLGIRQVGSVIRSILPPLCFGLLSVAVAISMTVTVAICMVKTVNLLR